MSEILKKLGRDKAPVTEKRQWTPRIFKPEPVESDETTEPVIEEEQEKVEIPEPEPLVTDEEVKTTEPELPKPDEVFGSQLAWTRTQKFIKFPRLIVADKHLSTGAKTLALILASFDMRRGGEVFPGLDILSIALGKSRPIVIKHLDELEDNGYIQRRRRWSKSTKTITTFPSIKTVDELLGRYQLFGIHLTIEDFEVFELPEDDLKELLAEVRKLRKLGLYLDKHGEISPIKQNQRISQK